MSEELRRHLDLTSRDLNHARHILECRTPDVASRITESTGANESTVRTVLGAACDLHTFWQSGSDTPPTSEHIQDQRLVDTVYDLRVDVTAQGNGLFDEL